MNSKLLITFLLGILLVSTASAYFLPTKDYNQETETIKIDNAFGIFGKVAEYNLTYNTEQCLINCYAEGTATLYESGYLFSELNFENKKGKEINLANNKILILINESYEEEIIDWKQDCSKTTTNGTAICESVENGKHNETKFKEYWEEYNFEKLDKGNYKWRIEGTKTIGQSVDWIASAFGTELKEWAWWNDSWSYNIPINIKENSGDDLNNYSILIYIPYDSDMQTDFDDLRFLDSTQTTELGYWIENKTDSNYAYVWVKIPSLTASINNTIYAYFGNAGVNSNSNKYDAFLFVDDFSDYSSSLITSKNRWVNNSGQTCNYQVNTNNDYLNVSSAGGYMMNCYSAAINGTKLELANGTIWYSSYTQEFPAYGEFVVKFKSNGVFYNSDSITSEGVSIKQTTSSTNFFDIVAISTAIYSTSASFNTLITQKLNFNSTTIIGTIKNNTNVGNLNISSYNLPDEYISIGQFGNTYGYLKEVIAMPYTHLSPTTYLGNKSTLTNIVITLNYPVDNYNSSSQTINFNATILPTLINLTNQTLKVNGIENVINVSGTETKVFNWTETLSDGNYTWNVTSCGVDILALETICVISDNRNFSIDSISPTINISAGNGTSDYGTLATNHTLNYTITDSHLDSCWISYNGTNTTIPCTSGMQNSTNFTIQYNVYNATIFANDTFGNLNSLFFNWSYRLFENYQIYDTSLFEGVPTSIYINLVTNGSDITQGNLSYNGTIYEGTISNHGGNNFTISREITTPGVSADSNLSFFWNISQNGFYYALSSKNQTVLNLAIDNCSVLTNVLYNFTLVDEENKSTINASYSNSSVELNLQIYSYGSSNLIQSFNTTYDEINPFGICLTSNMSGGGNFNLYVQLQYTADGYVTRLYHLQNETINSSSFPTNITLRVLNSSNAQPFKIIYRNPSFVPVQDALVKVYKKYISENEYNIVEIPKTDGRGEASINLVLNKELYKIEIVKYGVVLSTFTDMIAICQTPLVSTCQIDLNAIADKIVIPDYEEGEDFLFTIGYNNITRVISSSFSIPSGEVVPVSLNVSREDALGTAVCSNILTSSSGTLSCVVPESFGNSTITAVLYRSGEYQAQGSVKLNQNPVDLYGSVLVMLALFIMITLFGAGISDNPVYSVLFLMVGVILLYALNIIANNGFIGATATILFLVIAVILIIVKGARRN